VILVQTELTRGCKDKRIKKKLAGKVAKKGKNCGREEAMFKTWK
jgi:hypothetical protein